MSFERPQKSLDLNQPAGRRDALEFIGRVALGTIFSMAMASKVNALPTYEEKVVSLIKNLGRMFGKDGSEARKCETGENGTDWISTETLSRYLNAMGGVAAALERAYDRAPVGGSPLEDYLVRGKIGGLQTWGFPESLKVERMKDAIPGTKPPVVRHNSYVVDYRGKRYEVTARHCKEAGFFGSSHADVAIRDVSESYQGDALDFNQKETDSDLQGKIGVIGGTDVQGNETRIHTLFVRARAPLLRSLLKDFDQKIASGDKDMISSLDSYLCVLPPEWGYNGGYGKEKLMGVSGSFSGIINDTGELRTIPGGPVIAVRTVSSACEDFAGTCATIGLVSTRQSVIDTIDEYEQSKNVHQRPPRPTAEPEETPPASKRGKRK